MHPLLNHNLFFVKEQTGIFKAANSYDIFDPNTGQKIIECREPDLGMLTQLFRFTDYKRMTPFRVELRAANGELLLTVKRGISIFVSNVEVHDGAGGLIGGFKQKLFSIGGKFDVLDAQERVTCTLQGKWTRWDFRFVRGQEELASVSKQWAGLGKEMFTSADNYMLEIKNTVPSGNPVRALILAAVVCIDMVLKE